MGRADFRRAVYAVIRESLIAFHCVSEGSEVSEDFAESDIDVLSDVLKEAESRSDLSDDPGDVGPEVAGVIDAALSTGDGKRLAWVAPNDAIHRSTPRLAVEGFDIAPHRSRIQGFCLEARYHKRGGVSFSLNVTDGASCASCQLDAEIKSPVPGAEGEDIESSVGVWGT